MEIKFGMLQQLKSKSMGAQGANSASAKLNVSNAESVFKQYEKYKTQMAEAEQNGGETASNTAMPFGNTSMSVSELQSKMDECVEEFNKYYMAMNDVQGEKPQQGANPENKDEKNKIKPKEFGSMMA